jgi:hypothetical protein
MDDNTAMRCVALGWLSDHQATFEICITHFVVACSPAVQPQFVVQTFEEMSKISNGLGQR